MQPLVEEQDERILKRFLVVATVIQRALSGSPRSKRVGDTRSEDGPMEPRAWRDIPRRVHVSFLFRFSCFFSLRLPPYVITYLLGSLVGVSADGAALGGAAPNQAALRCSIRWTGNTYGVYPDCWRPSPPSFISSAHFLALGVGSKDQFGWRPTSHRRGGQERKSVITEPNRFRFSPLRARCLFCCCASPFFLASQGPVSLLLEPSVLGVEPEDGSVLPFGVGGDAVMLRAGKVSGELKRRERRSPGSLQCERRVSRKMGQKEHGRWWGEEYLQIDRQGGVFVEVVCPKFPDSGILFFNNVGVPECCPSVPFSDFSENVSSFSPFSSFLVCKKALKIRKKIFDNAI